MYTPLNIFPFFFPSWLKAPSILPLNKYAIVKGRWKTPQVLDIVREDQEHVKVNDNFVEEVKQKNEQTWKSNGGA